MHIKGCTPESFPWGLCSQTPSSVYPQLLADDAATRKYSPLVCLPSHMLYMPSGLPYLQFLIGSIKLFLFSNKTEFQPLNLDKLQYFIDSGRIDPNETITMKVMKQSGVVQGTIVDGVKLLGMVCEPALPSISLLYIYIYCIYLLCFCLILLQVRDPLHEEF